jgi:hypothetical protein
MSNKIEIADVVKHIPSGERWIVARVDDVYVWPCGWPETRAYLSDCVLVENASDTVRKSLIEDLKKLPESDPRCFYRHEQDNKV